MTNTNKLAEAVALSDRITVRRIARALLRRTPFLGNSLAFSLARIGFKVEFVEEGVPALRLPKFGNYERSTNLLDQREVLFRALMVWAIRARIIDPQRNFIDVGAANGDSTLQ